MIYRATSRATVAIAAALTLSGCVGGLLGGGKPDTLYRFGPVAADTIPQATAAPRRTLALPVPQFSPAVAGDRILTTQGSEISYIKGVRWVSPAPTLYAAALDATVATRAPDIAVATRASGAAATVLTVSVNKFEASYPEAVIHVGGVASLADRATKTIVARLQFSGTAPAAAGTGPAIVAAFDAATMQSVTQIVDWANVTIPVPKQ